MIYLGCIICQKYGLDEFPLGNINGEEPTQSMKNIYTLCIVAKQINKKNYLSWPGNKISPDAKIETIKQENYGKSRINRPTDFEPRSRECQATSSNLY